jgi:hypothetical protein
MGITMGGFEILTLPSFQGAKIINCSNPPVAGGPCTSVVSAKDITTRDITINGEQIVTEAIIAFSDRGAPIVVVSTG